MITEIIRNALVGVSMLDTPEQIAAAGALLVSLSGLVAVRWLENRREHPSHETAWRLKDAA